MGARKSAHAFLEMERERGEHVVRVRLEHGREGVDVVEAEAERAAVREAGWVGEEGVEHALDLERVGVLRLYGVECFEWRGGFGKAQGVG